MFFRSHFHVMVWMAYQEMFDVKKLETQKWKLSRSSRASRSRFRTTRTPQVSSAHGRARPIRRLHTLCGPEPGP